MIVTNLCRAKSALIATTMVTALVLVAGARAATVTPYATGIPGSGVLLSPDGTTLYAATVPPNSSTPGSVITIDVASGAVSILAMLKGGLEPYANSLSLGPDGKLYGVGGGGKKKDATFIFRMDAVTGQQVILYSANLKDIAKDGYIEGTLTFDAQGRIYGERSDANNNGGSVFRFDPTTGVMKTLHVFQETGDCKRPVNGLVFAPATGLFYGTALSSTGQGNGAGAVFTIDPASGAENVVVYSGTQGVGGYPAGLILDPSGQLYVETQDGPGANSGSVFKIDPATNAVTPIYSFSGNAEGHFPTGFMTFGPDGSLYGAMEYGGALQNGDKSNDGTLFKLDVSQGVNTVIWTFTDKSGLRNPRGTMAVNSQGALFGSVYPAVFEYLP